MKYYAGIGSRSTPNDIKLKMEDLAEILSNRNYILRTGGAPGADLAFAAGATRLNYPGTYQVIRPEQVSVTAIHMANELEGEHWPLTYEFSHYLGRNVQIVLGLDLNEPAEFVICWTPNGALKGGTRIGIKTALKHSIPVYNLARVDDTTRLYQHLNIEE